jgi:type I restriction enzyme S subunit
MSFEGQEIKLADVIEIIGGGTPKTSVTEYWGGSIPWLSVRDFNNVPRYVEFAEKGITEKGLENSSTKLLNAGDLIISARGTVGALAQLKRPMAFNQSCYGIRGIANTSNTDFIFYVLKVEIEQLKRLAHGGVFDTITRDTFKNISIFLPSFDEQTLIANFLGALDDRITLLRETNTTLEAIAQALFKSWFIDFDPVRAKSEGKLPEGMDEITAALFPDSFEQSDSGEIPKGWESKLLGSLVVPKRGKMITRATIIDGNIPVVAGGIDPAYFHNQSNVSSPVVTISSSGNAGFVRLYQQDIWASDCSYISKEQSILVFYWYLLLKSNQEKIYLMRHGAVQQHVNPSDLMRLNVFFPNSLEIVSIFNEIVSQLFKKIELGEAQIKILTFLRDLLLPRLISGQLRISDAKVETEKMSA